MRLIFQQNLTNDQNRSEQSDQKILEKLRRLGSLEGPV